MRVLLTGHRGFIGALLTPRLLDRGHAVTGLDCGYFESCDFGASPPEVPTIWKDIRDVEAPDVAGVDAVVHLAALSNDPLGDLDPDVTFAVNHAATLRLAELAAAAGATRFVFLSTCSAYGAAGEAAVDETATASPLTAYAAAKVEAERDLATLAGGEMAIVCLRGATAYGVSPRLRLDLVLNNLAAAAHVTGRVLVRSDGTPWRPLVHADDIALAIQCALEAPAEAVRGETFNVGRDDENHRVRELAAMVAAGSVSAEVAYAANAAPDARSYRVDFSKAARALPGFRPSWTARAGVDELARAFAGVGLTPADLDGPRFTRVRQLRRLLETGRLDESLRWRARDTGSAGRG
jgi:nucleoside-diphosphate-sugar epimerase